MSNKMCILWLALLIPGTAVADKSNCNVTLPVTVFLPDGALVRKLGKDEFVAKRKQITLSIVSLAVNNGPKRTVFVVETGKQVPKAARSIETNVLSDIISDSRSEDSFALIAGHGPHNEVRFGESRDTLRTAILGLEDVPKGQNRQNGILDAVQKAVSWLQPHQPGDAIVVMTMGIENQLSTNNFKKTRDLLTLDCIRVFGFQLGPIVAGFYGTGVAPLPGRPGFIPSAYVSPNEESLNALSSQTGGFIFIEDTDSSTRIYKLLPERLGLLRQGGKQIYKAIKEYYLLTISSPDTFEIDVSGAVRAAMPKVLVTYPRKKNYCPESTNPEASR
jgi:hypothetical protein